MKLNISDGTKPHLRLNSWHRRVSHYFSVLLVFVQLSYLLFPVFLCKYIYFWSEFFWAVIECTERVGMSFRNLQHGWKPFYICLVVAIIILFYYYYFILLLFLNLFWLNLFKCDFFFFFYMLLCNVKCPSLRHLVYAAIQTAGEEKWNIRWSFMG